MDANHLQGVCYGQQTDITHHSDSFYPSVGVCHYLGILDYHRYSPAGWQVFTDLVIALVLVLSWLIPEAKKNNRNPWPWVLATVLMGSFGPLLYLATAQKTTAPE